MIGRGLINRAVATFVAAGAAFVAMVALGATVYYLLLLVVPPLIGAALTALLFALIAAVVALVFVRRAHGDDEDEEYDEPEGLGMRALRLFQMHMRVDPARHHPQPGCVDVFGRRADILGDGDDAPVADADFGADAVAGGNDGCVADGGIKHGPVP